MKELVFEVTQGELLPDSAVREFRITAADSKTYDSVVKEFLTTAADGNSNRRNGKRADRKERLKAGPGAAQSEHRFDCWS